MSIKEKIFDVLHKDLTRAKPECKNKDVILCPICLRKITKKEILKRGIEHIIPKVVIQQDREKVKKGITKNQRCGITILCRNKREIQCDSSVSIDGCNGYKGKIYDSLFKNLFDFNVHCKTELANRHRVAILIMAYLGAFQRYGYTYILRPNLEKIRLQFDYPNKKVTNYLDRIEYYLRSTKPQVITDVKGHPFMFIELPASLLIVFRRCKAFLPPIPKESYNVQTIDTLICK